MRRGAILDRDGTLIDFVRDAELGSVASAFHPAQLCLLPGVVSGLRRLADAGFVLAIATNQPGAAKGQVPASAIARTNRALVELLDEQGIAIAAVECCLHHPDGGPKGDQELVGPCGCRKPAPGLLQTLARELSLDVAHSWMIGDTAADLGAGRAAGLACAMVIPTGRCELCPLRDAPAPSGEEAPDVMADSFDGVVEAILQFDGGASK